MVKDYGNLLADDADYARRAARISSLAKDVSEIVSAEHIDALPSVTGRRIAFHSPCTLQHGQQLNGVVESLLTRLGFKLVAVRDSHLCCGSAGTYSVFQPELSRRLLEDKVNALQNKQPELILTANIGCLLHLQQAADVPVKHWLELITEQF